MTFSCCVLGPRAGTPINNFVAESERDDQQVESNAASPFAAPRADPRRSLRLWAKKMSNVGDVVGGLTIVTAEGIPETTGDEEPVGPTYRIIT